MFLTDAAVLQSVADLLKVDVASLPAYWTNVVAEAHAAAYNEMVGRLLDRGYTLAQITAWDQGVFYERMISLFWALTNGAGTSAFDPKFINQFDRRKDLDTVLLAVAGVYIKPGNMDVDAPGTVGFGAEDFSDCLIVPDFDDHRRGKTTRF